MQYTCGNCGMRLDSATAQVGSLERCPSCGQVNTVPDPATIPESTDPVVLSYANTDMTEIQYAGFWIRFVAAFIDNLILSIPGVIFGLIFGVSFVAGNLRSGSTAPAVGSAMITVTLIGLFSMVINWLYFAFMDSSKFQGSLGKRAVGVFITDGDGERLTFGDATKRFIIKNVGNIAGAFGGFFVAGQLIGVHIALQAVSVLWLAGFVVAAFHAQKRALHDILADTFVRKGKAEQFQNTSDIPAALDEDDFDAVEDTDHI